MSRDPLGRAPVALMVPAVLAVALLVVPLGAMVAATDLAALPDLLASETLRDALWLSVLTSTVAMVVCLVLGLPTPRTSKSRSRRVRAAHSSRRAVVGISTDTLCSAAAQYSATAAW